MLRPRAFASFIVAAIPCAMSLSCKSMTDSKSSSIASFILGVTTLSGAQSAIKVSGSKPAASGSSGPTATSSGGTILGGTTIYKVSGSSFQHIVISVDGISDYWDLTLPSSATSTSILISFAQAPPQSSFTVSVGAGSTGAVSGYSSVPVSLRTVGTGDVQVSVSWDAATDVDLHVVDPSNAEIYWASRSAASGGTLDLDSNPACSIDGVNNENVTWPTGRSPSGTYTVRLDYYSGCSASATNYVVTVNIAGRSPSTFTGSFTGSGDHGGAGSGRLITTFTK